jgi:hypothetical protein
LRDSSSILDRLEDPVDEAAVVVNMAVEGLGRRRRAASKAG